jgi:branched-chain amino acid transport system substrate-binding protein
MDKGACSAGRWSSSACSYINDSIGLIKAIGASGLSPKLVGGAMIGPQNGVVRAALGSLLNGLVNYEYWLPVPSLVNPEPKL